MIYCEEREEYLLASQLGFDVVRLARYVSQDLMHDDACHLLIHALTSTILSI